jgi:solute carrier family 25 carnitine/acylcarnitine transporter 20/29
LLYEYLILTVDAHSGMFLQLAGALAGMAYWTANFPFDTVKSIIQVQPHEHRQSIATVVKHLYRTKGLRGFYNVRIN